MKKLLKREFYESRKQCMGLTGMLYTQKKSQKSRRKTDMHCARKKKKKSRGKRGKHRRSEKCNHGRIIVMIVNKGLR